MRRSHAFSPLLAVCWAGLALAQSDHEADHGATLADAAVPLFDGLGDHHVAISTSSGDAQRSFGQGLMLV